MSRLGYTVSTVLCTCPQSQGRPKNWPRSRVPWGCVTDWFQPGFIRLEITPEPDQSLWGLGRVLSWEVKGSTSWYHVRVMTMIGHVIRWQTHRILNLFQATAFVVIVSLGQLLSVGIVQTGPGLLGWADSWLLVLPSCFCGLSRPWYSPRYAFRWLSLSPWDERSGISRCFTCDEFQAKAVIFAGFL